MPPAEQDDWIAHNARRACLFASPAGLAAARIYESVGELRNALAAFTRDFADPGDIGAESAAALRNAGLAEPPGWQGYGQDTFCSLPGQVEGWAFMADLMRDMLEDCNAPEEDADADDEPEREEPEQRPTDGSREEQRVA